MPWFYTIIHSFLFTCYAAYCMSPGVGTAVHFCWCCRGGGGQLTSFVFFFVLLTELSPHEPGGLHDDWSMHNIYYTDKKDFAYNVLTYGDYVQVQVHTYALPHDRVPVCTYREPTGSLALAFAPTRPGRILWKPVIHSGSEADQEECVAPVFFANHQLRMRNWPGGGRRKEFGIFQKILFRSSLFIWFFFFSLRRFWRGFTPNPRKNWGKSDRWRWWARYYMGKNTLSILFLSTFCILREGEIY